MAAAEQTQALREVSWDPQVSAYLEAALGVENFQQMKAAIGVPPLSTCLRVNTLKATNQEVLQELHTALPQHISNISPHPDVPVAIILKGSGPHHIDPAAAGVTKEVIISRKAGEAVLRGAQVFVPGVLAVSAGLTTGDLVAVTVALDLPGTSHCGITRGTVIPLTSDTTTNTNTNTNTTTSQSTTATVNGSNTSAAASADVAAAGGRSCVGIGRATMGRSEMFRVSHGVAVELVQRLYDLPSPPVDGQLRGRAMLQNLPSVVAAQVLNPTPDSRVLDMCAAPGGKTTMLAQIMGGKGQIVALDRSHAKVDDVTALAAELGCSHCVQAYKADSTKLVKKQDRELQKFQQLQWLPKDPWQQQQQAAQHNSRKDAENAENVENAEQQQRLQQPQQEVEMPIDASHLSAKAAARMRRRLAAMSARGQSESEAVQAEYRSYGLGTSRRPRLRPESFDYILLDAPCSALGLRPRLSQQHTLRELLETATYQRALMHAAVQLLKPGGHLVFSTCTISPAENEVNVRHLLDMYPCLKLVPAEPRVGGPGLTGPADVQALRQAVAAAAAAASPTAVAAGHKAADAAVARVTAVGMDLSDTSHGRWGSVDAWCGKQWLSPTEAAMVQRFNPCDPADTIGFFIAKFQKVCSCQQWST